jgi:hypothetical protein
MRQRFTPLSQTAEGTLFAAGKQEQENPHSAKISANAGADFEGRARRGHTQSLKF